MKTISRMILLLVAFNLCACASGFKNQEPQNQCVETCVKSQPNFQQTLAESFAAGLGAGFGWGIGSALTRNW